MNKMRFFLGTSCLILSIGAAIGASAMTTVAPEYYYDFGICKLVPVTTNCTGGVFACIVDVDPSPNAVLLKQIYDNRNSVTTCTTPLSFDPD